VIRGLPRSVDIVDTHGMDKFTGVLIVEQHNGNLQF
jgi:hypothetical protein